LVENIPKRWKIYQNSGKYTNTVENIPNCRYITEWP
jgi:hypothetical protein